MLSSVNPPELPMPVLLMLETCPSLAMPSMVIGSQLSMKTGKLTLEQVVPGLRNFEKDRFESNIGKIKFSGLCKGFLRKGLTIKKND
jgi:hypothetical protein